MGLKPPGRKRSGRCGSLGREKLAETAVDAYNGRTAPGLKEVSTVMIRRRRLASAILIPFILALSGCGKPHAEVGDAVLILRARESVIAAGSSTRLSLYLDHPSPALPAIGWEADSGSIVRTPVANEVTWNAPLVPGTARIRAKAVIDRTEHEASITIRVAYPGAFAGDAGAPDGSSSAPSGLVDKLLFADPGPLYVAPREPSAVDPVTVKFRTRAGFGSRVTLNFARDGVTGRMEMVRADSDPAFEYHVAEIPPGAEAVEYWFEVQAGSERLYYSRAGTTRSAPAEPYRFKIVPGRRVPSWTRGAVLYLTGEDYFGDAGLDGLSRRADYFRSIGADAVVVSRAPKLGPWNAERAAAAAERLAGRNVRLVLAAVSADEDDEALAKEVGTLAAAATRLAGVAVTKLGSAPDLAARAKEALKAANPEGALLADPLGALAADADPGDFYSDPRSFAEPLSAYLLGKDLSGKPLAAPAGDAAAFARAFAEARTRAPQHMEDNVILSLEADGSQPFLQRAARSAGTAADTAAAESAAEEAMAAYRLALFMQMCLPGSPLVVAGAEAGSSAPAYPRDAEDRDVLALHRDLAALRKPHAALRTGSFSLVAAEADGLLAWARWTEKERILLIVNASPDYVLARIPLGQLGLDEGEKLRTVFSLAPVGQQPTGPSYAVKSGEAAVPMGGRTAIALLGTAPDESIPSAPLRPRVVRTFPANKSKGIAEDTRIIIQFSGPMDQESVLASFSLKPEARGEFVWNGGTCSFVPAEPLQRGTLYEVSVSRPMRARGGGFSMEAGIAFAFTTR